MTPTVRYMGTDVSEQSSATLQQKLKSINISCLSIKLECYFNTDNTHTFQVYKFVLIMAEFHHLTVRTMAENCITTSCRLLPEKGSNPINQPQ